MASHSAIECVRLVPIFEALNAPEVEAIAELIHDRQYAAGQMLFTEGSSADALLIVGHGQIKITKSVPSGREQLLRLLQPGDFDGEAVLFTDFVHTTSATALAPTTVCSIRQQDFQAMLKQTPAIALAVMNALGQRLVALEERITSTAVTSVQERLAAYLVDTGAALGTDSFDLPLMKKDLALYLGTTPETLSRKLTQFSDRGLIRLTGRQHIELIDADNLAMET